MSLRILHTADNHIGLSFHQYGEPARERLIEERFAALDRLVTTANDRKAHFFVVAGDLFDKTTVTKAQVERAVKILANFEGEAVLVLAGNHDFCEGPDSKLWKQFRAAADGTCVLALTEASTKDFTSDDYQVRFYACPCPSKHGKQHTIGWVVDEEKPTDMLHIGIAHGNVEGLGLDADQRYFHMTESDFRLLGICLLRDAPERANGSDRLACRSLGEDWRAGKRGLMVFRTLRPTPWEHHLPGFRCSTRESSHRPSLSVPLESPSRPTSRGCRAGTSSTLWKPVVTSWIGLRSGGGPRIPPIKARWSSPLSRPLTAELT